VLIGFFDDTEVNVNGKIGSNIYVFGGYFVMHHQLDQLQKRISKIKGDYGLKGNYPVKWNLRDGRLKRFYEDRGLKEAYKNLLGVSDEIRRSLLQLLKEFHAIVMACGLYRQIETTKHVNCYRWAFENLLQRIGLMAQSRDTKSNSDSSLLIVVDWPQEGVSKSLFDIYMSGYHDGIAVDSSQPYFSGPLSLYRFADSVYHSSTLHCSPLQLADLVAGIIKDFIRWCKKGNHSDRVKYFFPIIGSSFYCSDKGVVNGYGLKVSGITIDLDAKIKKLLQTDGSEVIHG